MAVAGSARAVSLVLLVVRAKVVAVLLGPAGIGLLGILTSLQETGAQAADGGLSHSAVRQVAQARDHPRRLARLRQALLVAVLVPAAAAAIGTWVWRTEIAEAMTGSTRDATTFGLLGIGIALMMIYRWQQALLAGYRQVRALAGLTVLASVIATGAGLALIAAWGEQGLIWAVLAGPAAGAALAPFALRTLPGTRPVRPHWPALLGHWGALYRLGLGLMLSALALLLTPLVLRAWLTHKDGLEAAGLYQAALVIAMHLTGLILAAVATEFYPRLSATIARGNPATPEVNLQTRLHLAVGGPVALGVIAAAPVLLAGLYTEAFATAAPLLRWLLLAAVLRLATAPVEMILMAQGRPGLILGAQVAHQAAVLILAIGLFDILGAEGIGLAALAGQALHLGLLGAITARTAAFRWQIGVLARLGLYTALGAAIGATAHLAPDRMVAAGIVATLAAVALGGRDLVHTLRQPGTHQPV